MQDEMKSTEAIQMMNRCKQEILSLRSVIARLEPKADAYDNLVSVLRLLPPRSVGNMLGEDMVWVLDKRIRELEPKKEVGASAAGST